PKRRRILWSYKQLLARLQRWFQLHGRAPKLALRSYRASTGRCRASLGQGKVYDARFCLVNGALYPHASRAGALRLCWVATGEYLPVNRRSHRSSIACLHIPVSEHVLRQKGVEFHESSRGGDITYHGPGQIVGYPIFNLGAIRRDVVWYVRMLEETMIRTTAEFGIAAKRVLGKTGIWVDSGSTEGKLGAIGVHVR